MESQSNNWIYKKIAYLCVVLVANTLDIVFQLDGILVNGSVIFLILSEATSIIENAAILGVPIPDQITKRLNILVKITMRLNKSFYRLILLELINYVKRIFG